MIKNLLKAILISAFLFLLPDKSLAKDLVAGDSAKISLYGQCKLNSQISSFELLVKQLTLREFFREKNSPLAEQAPNFISSCQKYDLDCYLLPAIASIESYYGKRYIKSYNNPFGWGGGYYKFNSLDEAIDTVAKGLKTRYIARGATNLKSIGKYYSADSTWWIKTSKVKRELERKEKKFGLLLAESLVE